MDYNVMQMFSDFAAMAVRNQQQLKTILQQTRAAAAAEMAMGSHIRSTIRSRS